MLFDADLPDELRFCTWCQQGFPPTRENFRRCKHGRRDAFGVGLMTVCKSCQNHDARLRRKYRWEHEEPQACACGVTGEVGDWAQPRGTLRLRGLAVPELQPQGAREVGDRTYGAAELTRWTRGARKKADI